MCSSPPVLGAASDITARSDSGRRGSRWRAFLHRGSGTEDVGPGLCGLSFRAPRIQVFKGRCWIQDLGMTTRLLEFSGGAE